MKVKNLLMTSIVLLGLISANGFSMVNASSYPDGIQYQKDSDGNYDPVTNNGKGPALDIGNGKFGRLNKSQAEAWNSGQAKKSNKSESNKPSNNSYSSKESEPSNDSNDITTSKSKQKVQSIKRHHSNRPKVKSTRAKSSKSLNVVHAGLIWTGIVLIGAILIYCFINYRRNKIAIEQQHQLNTRSQRFKH